MSSHGVWLMRRVGTWPIVGHKRYADSSRPNGDVPLTYLEPKRIDRMEGGGEWEKPARLAYARSMQALLQQVVDLTERGAHESIVRLWNEEPSLRGTSGSLGAGVRLIVAYAARASHRYALAEELLAWVLEQEHEAPLLEMVASIWAERVCALRGYAPDASLVERAAEKAAMLSVPHWSAEAKLVRATATLFSQRQGASSSLDQLNELLLDLARMGSSDERLHDATPEQVIDRLLEAMEQGFFGMVPGTPTAFTRIELDLGAARPAILRFYFIGSDLLIERLAMAQFDCRRPSAIRLMSRLRTALESTPAGRAKLEEVRSFWERGPDDTPMARAFRRVLADGIEERRAEPESFETFARKAARSFVESARNVAAATRGAIREGRAEGGDDEPEPGPLADPEKADLLARFAALERKMRKGDHDDR